MGKARTSPKPVWLSASSNLHVPSSMSRKEKERDRRMGEGPRKWIKREERKRKKEEKNGQGRDVRYSFSLSRVSH